MILRAFEECGFIYHSRVTIWKDPFIVDASMISLFRRCKFKYKTRMEELWDTKGKAPALGFGLAWHEGVAEWRKGNDYESAARKFLEAYKRGMPGEYLTETMAEDKHGAKNGLRLLNLIS